MKSKNINSNISYYEQLLSSKGDFSVSGLPYTLNNCVLEQTADGLHIIGDVNLFPNGILQNNIQDNRKKLIILVNGKKTWSIAPRKYMPHDTTDNLLQENHSISINFNQLTNNWCQNRKMYQRLIVKIIHQGNFQHDLFSIFYRDNNNSFTRGLIEIQIKKTEKIDIYPYKSKTGMEYLVIETNFKCTIEQLLEYVRSIEMTLNLLCSLEIDNHHFIFSSSNERFENIRFSYRKIFHCTASPYTIFTTNMYWLKYHLETNNIKYALKYLSTKGKFNPNLQDWLYWDELSKVILLLHNNKAIERSLYIMFAATNSPLEYQSSLLCVALETICNEIMNKNQSKAQKVLEEDTWKDLCKKLLEILCTLDLNKSEKDILSNRINNLNNPTNQAKLSQPFSFVGYQMKEYEKNALNKRNNYLHGRLTDENYSDQAKKIKVDKSEQLKRDTLLYDALMFHKLYCILLLKYAGFTGYILNTPVLWKSKEAIRRREKPIFKI